MELPAELGLLSKSFFPTTVTVAQIVALNVSKQKYKEVEELMNLIKANVHDIQTKMVLNIIYNSLEKVCEEKILNGSYFSLSMKF